ncbi:hypothetical protein ACOCJ7_04325 [Knoellia sp. CPCC 206453]|uniref:hypothetical protein n=1 Tax=Knoellia pratensis TaxID=3404796 RepID=UPI00361DF9B8
MTIKHDRWRVLPGWAVLVGGAAAFWVVGHMPWIVHGMHAEVSAGWARFDTLKGPVVALPFNEYAFPTLLVGGVIGGTAALAVSFLAAPGVRHRRGLAAAGALIALVIALTQTYLAVRPGLVQSDEARLLVGALVAAALGTGVFGVLVGVGVARGKGWPLLLGGATAASLAGSWFVDLLFDPPGPIPEWLNRIAQLGPWVSGILLGVVLAVCGFRPTTRLLGWFVALAIGWVVPSVLTLMVYVTGYASQGSPRAERLREVADAGRDVFVQSLSPSNHVTGPLVAAVVIGIVGATWRLNRATARPEVAAEAG